jgi:hypothetical protein
MSVSGERARYIPLFLIRIVMKHLLKDWQLSNIVVIEKASE